MKNFLCALLCLLMCAPILKGQSGSASDPFTTLAQAQTVPAAGIYNFNLTGTAFSTYVRADGYVMVIIDFGNGTGALTPTSALTEGARGILSATALSKLTTTASIRMIMSTGAIDATTTNTAMIGRMRNNQSLMNSSAHNGDNKEWIGTGQENLRADASGTAQVNSLAAEVYHVDGNGAGVHWFPQRGDQAPTFSNEIGPNETVRLYAKSAEIVNEPGSNANPFTQLAQARTVPAPGIYTFNLNGTPFDTYVDGRGYVQVAIDFGNGVGDLPGSTGLNTTTRGILDPAALSGLTDANEVRFTSSVPNTLDAVSFEGPYIDRVVANQSLMFDSEDNDLNDSWTGTGANFLQVDATTNRAPRPSLANEVYHTFGNGEGMTWYPNRNDQAISFQAGNIPDNEHLTLWVRAPEPVEPLGTATNPFTSLTDAAGVTTPGRYFFDLGGPVFDTYVDEQGWVQLALDFRNGSGELPGGNSLSRTTDGILSPAALASLTEMSEARISSSVPNYLDARTSNTGVTERILSNQPIKSDFRDNEVNRDWTGLGSEEVNKDAAAPNENNEYATLSQEIYHNFFGPNGGEGLHWIPNRGDMGLKFQNDIANDESFMLWARAQPAGLPLLLQRFGVTEDRGRVSVSWEVYAANGGDYVDIQHSPDGVEWHTVDHTYLTATPIANRRTFLHTDLPGGTHYYRLRQTDFDGILDYSFVRAITLSDRAANLTLYPNPATSFITITGLINTEAQPEVYDARGGAAGAIITVLTRRESSLTLDVSRLLPGLYYLRIADSTRSFVKR